MSKRKHQSSKRKEIVVQSIDDLIRITKRIDPLKPAPRISFSLQLSYLSKEQRTYYERKLSKNFSSCGCDSGAALGMFSLVVYILVATLSAKSFSWMHILFGAIIFSVASLIGKLTGITKSNYEVKKIVKELSNMETTMYRLNN